jgi:tRNA-specific 2-thiouridylase
MRAAERIRPGPIVDERGDVVGIHDGVHRFTVGQRKGLGVALGRPAFVTGIEAQTATVHVGREDALLSHGAHLADLSLADGVSLPARARVRVRYRHEGDDALVERIARGDAKSESAARAARVVFDRPVRAITSGQIAVMYAGDRVIGGGRIVAPLPKPQPQA